MTQIASFTVTNETAAKLGPHVGLNLTENGVRIHRKFIIIARILKGDLNMRPGGINVTTHVRYRRLG